MNWRQIEDEKRRQILAAATTPQVFAGARTTTQGTADTTKSSQPTPQINWDVVYKNIDPTEDEKRKPLQPTSQINWDSVYKNIDPSWGAEPPPPSRSQKIGQAIGTGFHNLLENLTPQPRPDTPVTTPQAFTGVLGQGSIPKPEPEASMRFSAGARPTQSQQQPIGQIGGGARTITQGTAPTYEEWQAQQQPQHMKAFRSGISQMIDKTQGRYTQADLERDLGTDQQTIDRLGVQGEHKKTGIQQWQEAQQQRRQEELAFEPTTLGEKALQQAGKEVMLLPAWLVGYPAATKLISKIPQLSRLAGGGSAARYELTRGATAGMIVSPVESAILEETLQEAGIRLGINTIIGGSFDAAIGTIGRAIAQGATNTDQVMTELAKNNLSVPRVRVEQLVKEIQKPRKVDPSKDKFSTFNYRFKEDPMPAKQEPLALPPATKEGIPVGEPYVGSRAPEPQPQRQATRRLPESIQPQTTIPKTTTKGKAFSKPDTTRINKLKNTPNSNWSEQDWNYFKKIENTPIHQLTQDEYMLTTELIPNRMQPGINQASFYRGEIEKAIGKGMVVPDHVMAQFPDMQPKLTHKIMNEDAIEYNRGYDEFLAGKKLDDDTLPMSTYTQGYVAAEQGIPRQMTVPKAQPSKKQTQLEIINKNNPAPNEQLTWVRNVNDIQDPKKVFIDEFDGGTPDFTATNATNAFNKGKVTVYSSTPIEQGAFVTPSKMEAKSYAGSGKIYQKQIDINDVAWIDSLQGQYAKVTPSKQVTPKVQPKVTRDVPDNIKSKPVETKSTSDWEIKPQVDDYQLKRNIAAQIEKEAAQKTIKQLKLKGKLSEEIMEKSPPVDIIIDGLPRPSYYRNQYEQFNALLKHNMEQLEGNKKIINKVTKEHLADRTEIAKEKIVANSYNKELWEVPKWVAEERHGSNVIGAKKHKEAVTKALKEGKSVPKEVLKDYPDLITKPTTKLTPKTPIKSKQVTPRVPPKVTRDVPERLKTETKLTPDKVSVTNTTPTKSQYVVVGRSKEGQETQTIKEGVLYKGLALNDKNQITHIKSGLRLLDLENTNTTQANRLMQFMANNVDTTKNARELSKNLNNAENLTIHPRITKVIAEPISENTLLKQIISKAGLKETPVTLARKLKSGEIDINIIDKIDFEPFNVVVNGNKLTKEQMNSIDIKTITKAIVGIGEKKAPSITPPKATTQPIKGFTKGKVIEPRPAGNKEVVGDIYKGLGVTKYGIIHTKSNTVLMPSYGYPIRTLKAIAKKIADTVDVNKPKEKLNIPKLKEVLNKYRVASHEDSDVIEEAIKAYAKKTKSQPMKPQEFLSAVKNNKINIDGIKDADLIKDIVGVIKTPKVTPSITPRVKKTKLTPKTPIKSKQVTPKVQPATLKSTKPITPKAKPKTEPLQFKTKKPKTDFEKRIDAQSTLPPTQKQRLMSYKPKNPITGQERTIQSVLLDETPIPPPRQQTAIPDSVRASQSVYKPKNKQEATLLKKVEQLEERFYDEVAKGNWQQAEKTWEQVETKRALLPNAPQNLFKQRVKDMNIISNNQIKPMKYREPANATEAASLMAHMKKTDATIAKKELQMAKTMNKGNKQGVYELGRQIKILEQNLVKMHKVLKETDLISLTEGSIMTPAEEKILYAELLSRMNVSKWKSIGTADRLFSDPYALDGMVAGTGRGDALYGRDNVMTKILREPLERAKLQMVNKAREIRDVIENKIIKELKIKPKTRENELVFEYGEKVMQEKTFRELYKNTETLKRFDDEVAKQIRHHKHHYKNTATKDDISQIKHDLLTKHGFSDAELAKVTGRPQDIKKAAKILKDEYDKFYNVLDKIYKAKYPNNPNKWVYKRENYMRHFTEHENPLRGLNFLDSLDATAKNKINPFLEGLSHETKPNMGWSSITQERGGSFRYKRDAIGAFENYAGQALKSTYIDPHITRYYAIADVLSEMTQKSKHLNDYIKAIRNQGAELAGKTSWMDRAVNELIGREKAHIFNQITLTIRASLLGANPGIYVTQASHIAPAIARIKNPARIAKGYADSIKYASGQYADDPILKSAFMQERYNLRHFSDFYNKTNWGKLRDATLIPIEKFDGFFARPIWYSIYDEALEKGVKEPIKYADKVTRAIVAGRGIGERPEVLKSHIAGNLLPFMVEVNNLYQLHKSFWKGSKASFATFAVSSYLYNEFVTQPTRGDRLLADPINLGLDITDIVGDETVDNKAARAAGLALGELLYATPITSPVSAAMPNQWKPYLGGRIGGRVDARGILALDIAVSGLSKGIDTGKNYGVPAGVTVGATDLALSFLPGGGQVRKTTEGARAIKQGYSMTGTSLGEEFAAFQGLESKDKIRFPVSDDKLNKFRTLVFGQYSTPEAREYFENKLTPLTEKQTRQVKDATDPMLAYKTIITKRLEGRYDAKIRAVYSDETLSRDEQDKKAKPLRKARQELWAE